MDYPIQLPDQLREYLRGLREQRGLTQAALGRLIGVSQGRIAEIELNPGVVSMAQMMRVLAALQAGLVVRDEGAPAPASSRSSHKPSRKAPAGDSPPLKKGAW